MRKKIILPLLVGGALACGVSAAMLAAPRAAAVAAELNGVNLESRYRIGSVIELPKATLTLNDITYAAEAVVHEPNGKAYRADSVKADQLGSYKIEYRTRVNGAWIREYASFDTYDELYSFSGALSRGEYGAETKYETGIEGLKLSLAEGEVFTYNEVIDLGALGPDRSFIEFFATPSRGAGERDIFRVGIRLTDAHDASNYVTIYAQSIADDGYGNPWWLNNTYVAAAPVGKTPTGIEWGPPVNIHAGSRYGYPVPYSLYGYRDWQNSVGKEFFSLSMDVETNCLYGPRGVGGNYIIDLDDFRYFGEVWKGFTNGEVYVSVWGEDYFADSFDLLIDRIGDRDLSVADLTDREGPTLTVDCEEYDPAALPDAYAGRRYPVFPATAHDSYAGDTDVTVKVFYNYHSESRFEMAIKEGWFVPTQKGSYTIEYSSCDNAGNVSVKTLVVGCTEGPAFSVTAEPETLSALTGEVVLIPFFTVRGNVGNVVREISVTLDGEEIETVGGSFLPEKAGKYVVTCAAKDMIGQEGAYSYEVNVALNPDPVIHAVPVPTYVVADCEYPLPAFTATDYVSGKEIACTLFVTDGRVNEQAVTDKFAFTPDSEGGAWLVYRAQTAQGSAEQRFRVRVVRAVGYASYAVSSEAQIRARDNGVSVLAQGDAAFDFVSPLTSSPNWEFRLVPNGGATSVTFTLTDRASSASVEITLRKGVGDNSAVYVNGVRSERVVYGLFTREYSIRLRYDNATKTVWSGDVALATVCNADGSAFAGFGANGTMLSGSVSASGEAELILREVCGQKLYGNEDKAPVIDVLGSYGVRAKTGDEITVHPAFITDILTPVFEGTVTVYSRNTDSNVLESTRVDEAHSFKPTAVGTYVILYEATDKNGHTAKVEYKLTVVDGVAPEITLRGENPEEVRAGEFRIAKADGIDNVDRVVAAYCFIITPHGTVIPVETIFTAETDTHYTVSIEVAGDYIIRYLAMDSASNVAIVEYALHILAA